MYFNPRIEAWLHRVTNTSAPEFKSDLHASNGIGNGKKDGYEKLTDEQQPDAEKEKGMLGEKGDGKKPKKKEGEEEEIQMSNPEAEPLRGIFVWLIP